MSLAGLEVGVRGCSAMTITADGQLVAQTQAELQPARKADGTVMLEMPELWKAVRETIGELAIRAAAQHEPIQALCITSPAETLAPLANDGRPLDGCLLGPAPQWEETQRELEGQIRRERLIEITGRQPEPGDGLLKIIWQRTHEPELYRATWRYVPAATLVTTLLGGLAACDHSLAAGMGLLDAGTLTWSDSLCLVSHVARYKLPDLAPAGQPAGLLAPRLASELGLSPKTQLAVGARDVCCAALGAGAIESGQALLLMEATLTLMPVFEALPLAPLLYQQGLSIEPHLVPGRWVTQLYHRFGGRALRWFRDQMAPLEAHEAQRRGYDFYERLLSELPEAPSRLLVLPDLEPAGPPEDWPAHRGVILGLSSETSRGELLKALLEGVALHLAGREETLLQAGVPILGYRAAGGGARSEAWLQLLADVLGKPVAWSGVADTTTLGAALVAGIGAGVYRDAQQACREAVPTIVEIRPRARRQAHYRQRAQELEQLRGRLSAEN